jgi:signal peptidase I
MEIVPPKNQEAAQPAYQRPPEYTYGPPSTPPAPPSSQKPPRSDSFKSILSTIGLFASAFLIAILLNTFVIQSYQVDGESMEPTLQNNDRLIVDKVSRSLARIDGHQYVPHRGDIIIFNIDSIPGFVGQKQLIKRVIGLPGEHVVVKNGHITVYNAKNPQGFNPDAAGTYTPNQPTTNDVDLVLGPNQLFVCGDNRPNSEDSRYFGPINTNQVVAKLVLRILPVSGVKSY